MRGCCLNSKRLPKRSRGLGRMGMGQEGLLFSSDFFLPGVTLLPGSPLF